MKRDVTLFINDVIENIKDIESFSNKLTKDALLKDKLRQNAIIRSLEIIGEAVKNIPDSFRDKYPDVSWRKIAGLRDIIIHAYFNLDLDITWDIIKKDIPVLKNQFQKIKEDLNN